MLLTNIRNNPRQHSVYIIPGRNGSVLPYGKFKVKAVYTPQDYLTTLSIESDIAVIKVEHLNNKSIGDVVPILPTKLAVTVEKGMPLSTADYPGDELWATMWSAKGTVQKTTGTRIYFDMDTVGGQSGSPIFNANNEIIDVHTIGMGSVNFGTRLNTTRYQFVSDHNS